MSIKRKLGLGVASAAIGLSLVAGGTFAYFSDTEVTQNTFAAGTLDLSVNPTTIIDVDNIKPGDWMNRSFVLSNDGSLDISKVLLKTDYKVFNQNNQEISDGSFGHHIRVNFLWNEDKASLGPLSPDQVVFQTTLADLRTMTPDAVANAIFIPYFEERGGLKSGDSDKLFVQFEFVDNGQDQNKFQGHSLQLEWTFEAHQTPGESR